MAVSKKNFFHSNLKRKKSSENPRNPFLLAALFSVICLCASKNFRPSDPNDTHNSRRMQRGVASAAKTGVSSVVSSSPKTKQSYELLRKTRLSHDSFLLQYGLPEGRTILGIDPSIPTCIKIDYKPPSGIKALSKSYSPVTHPNQEGCFDLVVKAYADREGGGVGKYLCDMEVGDSISAKLKGERVVHGSTSVLDRGWKNVGLVAGGTGIAPLLQIARILLEAKDETETKIHLLFINHTKEDILGKEEIEVLAREHPGRFLVTYSFTREAGDDDAAGGGQCDSEGLVRFARGRGDPEMARSALPVPSVSEEGQPTDTMIFVCGRDGFVAHWAGPVARAPPLPDGSKGPKIQGALLGVLADAGFTADQVFKY